MTFPTFSNQYFMEYMCVFFPWLTWKNVANSWLWKDYVLFICSAIHRNVCSPPARWGSLDFIRGASHPSPPSPPPFPPPPPSPSPRPPAPNRELQISVVTAGPQPRAPDLRRHRTSTASSRATSRSKGDLGHSCRDSNPSSPIRRGFVYTCLHTFRFGSR